MFLSTQKTELEKNQKTINVKDIWTFEKTYLEAKIQIGSLEVTKRMNKIFYIIF